jgi:hypothetical protein
MKLYGGIERGRKDGPRAIFRRPFGRRPRRVWTPLKSPPPARPSRNEGRGYFFARITRLFCLAWPHLPTPTAQQILGWVPSQIFLEDFFDFKGYGDGFFLGGFG